MIKTLLKYILDIIYPPECIVCHTPLIQGEEYICFNCILKLPLARLPLNQPNKAEKLFWGFVKIEKATALFYYENGSDFTHLLHQLKYYGQSKLGVVLGEILSIHISPTFFEGVDLIIPVPIHIKKRKIRGYNQAECLAKGISNIYYLPVDTTTLIKIKETDSQTRKSVYERRTNTEGTFMLTNTTHLHSKHILLIDDVLTTGSTLIACAQLLKSIPKVKVSILTLAITRSH